MAEIRTKHIEKGELTSAISNIFSHSYFSEVEEGVNMIEWKVSTFPEIDFNIFEKTGLQFIINDEIDVDDVLTFNTNNHGKYKASAFYTKCNFKGEEINDEPDYDILMKYGRGFIGKYIKLTFDEHFISTQTVDTKMELIKDVIKQTTFKEDLNVDVSNNKINFHYDHNKIIALNELDADYEQKAKRYKKKEKLIDCTYRNNILKEFRLYIHSDDELSKAVKQVKSEVTEIYDCYWRIVVDNLEDYDHIRQIVNASNWSDFDMVADVMEEGMGEEQVLDELDSARYFSRRIGDLDHPDAGRIDVSLRFYGDKTSYGGESEGYIGPNEGEFIFHYEPIEWDRDKEDENQEKVEKLINSFFETEEDVIHQEEF